jgi:hypothetical protein
MALSVVTIVVLGVAFVPLLLASLDPSARKEAKSIVCWLRGYHVWDRFHAGCITNDPHICIFAAVGGHQGIEMTVERCATCRIRRPEPPPLERVDRASPYR